MTRCYRLRMSLLFLPLTFAAVTALARSSAAPPASSQSTPSQKKITRSSADGFATSRGKLGQDLFLAVAQGNVAGVQSLLKQGADPNARNALQMTPLQIAAAAAPPPIVEALLKAGAKLEPVTPYGTPLLFAALTGNAPNIQLLISRGADINAVRPDGINLLMLVCRHGLTDIAAELIRRKADVNARDNDGATPLIYASREGQTEVARILLEAGAKVDGADRHGWTPLMYASANGHVESVRLLLEKGANPNARDDKGRTPLLLTATYGDHSDVARALLQGGADARATDSRKRTAHALAVARGHTECAGLLGDAADTSAAASQRAPREAIQLSLKAIQHSILEFDRRTGCVSCHQEGLGRIATGAAHERGFALDPAVERAQLERINGAVSALRPVHLQALKNPEMMKQVPLIEMGDIPYYYGVVLAGMAAHKQPATEATGAMAMVAARTQLPDGHWLFGLPRVPMQSSYFTMTAMVIRAMRAYGPTAYAKEIDERISRAKAWLLATPTRTSEDKAFRLLGLKWAGASAEECKKAAEELRAEQRPDGGWSQLPTLQSDAYATGQALYALHLAGGLAVTDPVYARGVQFLLRTQDEDGSWFVNKRALPANNYFDAGFPHGQSQYASFNGTCWATLALLQTVDHPQLQASRPIR